jgi:hypothetical protein
VLALGFADAQSTLFLTAAHCFFKDATLVGGPSTVEFDTAVHACQLVAHFYEPHLEPGRPGLAYGPDSLDLAVLRCATRVPIPAALLTAAPYAAHTPVALVGFTRGEHLDPRHIARVTHKDGTKMTFALHTKISRLSSSFQTPDAQNVTVSEASSSRGFIEDALPPLFYEPAASVAAGFVDLSPWAGMSGGAVVDMRCGLLGIIALRSMHALGGQFVRLLPAVLERIAAAVRMAD